MDGRTPPCTDLSLTRASLCIWHWGGGRCSFLTFFNWCHESATVRELPERLKPLGLPSTGPRDVLVRACLCVRVYEGRGTSDTVACLWMCLGLTHDAICDR